MKVTLTHDGKSVELDLTAEQMTALGLKEEKKKTGYERVGRYRDYWIVNDDDHIFTGTESIANTPIADQRYSIGNYYSDADLARANARADRLMRELRRFAAENGGIPSVEDNKKCESRAIICYKYTTGELVAESRQFTSMIPGCVSFVAYMAAELAIKKFHDELIWYFTEYEAMLR